MDAKPARSVQGAYAPGVHRLDHDVPHIGPASRATAEAKLRDSGMCDGHYIVRQSENDRKAYGLTVVYNGIAQHYKIDSHDSPRTGRTKFGIGDGLRWEFLNDLISHYHEECDGMYCKLKQNIVAICRDHLKLGNELGAGEFGTVRVGLWQVPGEMKMDVAVKSLRSDSPLEKIAFLEEGERMAGLGHPNIVKLIGMCTKQEPTLLVCELVKEGALRNYLKKHKDRITVPMQLTFVMQIATGMAYLEDEGIVHRDLAARNVLVASETCVKISDFGMSRKVEHCYTSKRQGKWPLKWYAPECIEQSRFTSQSDVWSFGVTAWECMTFGMKPFKGLTGQMVVQTVIVERKRLPCPPTCPQPLFALMNRCWQHEAEDRPRFKDMIGEIAAMTSQAGSGGAGGGRQHYENLSNFSNQ